MVADREAIDRIRRDARGNELLRVTTMEPSAAATTPDDRLRLLFTCCHPALARQSQVELTLRLVCGLSTADVARAFLTNEPAMAKRLVRTKHKIKAANIPYRIPGDAELPDRLRAVLAATYLTYTTGYGEPDRCPDLSGEAIELGRMLRLLMPDEPEVAGLLALMLLTQVRRRSRTDSAGELVLLRDQDRRLWDRDLIQEGHRLVRWCLRRNEPGRYQLEAAIAAVHAEAPAFEDTDWKQILALYDQLMTVAATPVVALNRAVAVGEVDGAARGLHDIDQLNLPGYYPFHAARAEFLHRQGHIEDAVRAFQAAASLAPDGAERRYLQRRAASI
ncbi:DUF6596 domain-containing protein [Kribbella sp. NPDC026596]|uniref:RNA polymerase sigma factor n=1 Tax=Kribbella sp. NPDC026596 TaxID=3155122 RepID=UPI0033C38685